MALIVPSTQKNLEDAAKLLRQGELVSFPTETVYGLGADASNAEAVEKIFFLKARPKTDPLIVHVLDLGMALPWCRFESVDQQKTFEKLAKTYWPGPLTLVIPSSEDVIPLVTAGTGWVGLRSPRDPVARALITLSQKALAAPSANRFGHVSPSLAQHVADDFLLSDLLIIDGGACEVGVESTVAKIEASGNVVVLRPGRITSEALSRSLESTNSVRQQNKHTTGSKAQIAPGQLLKHYAPILPCYLVDKKSSASVAKICDLSESVIIDFGAQLKHLKDSAMQYFDVSPSSDFVEACRHLFEVLRQAERVEAKAVLISQSELRSDDAAAFLDRIFRAAEGKKAVILGFDRAVYGSR